MHLALSFRRLTEEYPLSVLPDYRRGSEGSWQALVETTNMRFRIGEATLAQTSHEFNSRQGLPARRIGRRGDRRRSGIGKAAAFTLAQAGARVRSSTATMPAAQAVAREITGQGYGARAFEADVSDEASVENAVSRDRQRGGAPRHSQSTMPAWPSAKPPSTFRSKNGRR